VVAASLDAYVELPGAPNVVGTVPGVHGDTVLTVTYSKLGPAARLIAWMRLLALTASWPERPFEARTVGRARSTRHTISTATIEPLGPDPASRKAEAERHLRRLVDLFERGMREPLPLYCKTSASWAEAVALGKDPRRPAARTWESGFGGNNEDKNSEHELVLSGHLSFDAMFELAGPARADETGDGWDGGDPSRFGRYAARLWDGLLAHEQVVDQ
jgi:exodeoxyribonuclease V gamma subunit